jgi:hypothetical protein
LRIAGLLDVSSALNPGWAKRTLETKIPQQMKMIFLLAMVLALATCSAKAQPSRFVPGHLAVLRAGDGMVDLHLKQSPVFIDQFSPDGFNSSPSFSLQIPTNGPQALFFNGHAATEGTLARSQDHKLLAFAGYGGVNLLESNGTPSLLDIDRGFCTADANGELHTTLYGKHSGLEKMNPRGVVTDGTNWFWGCGNAYGTFCYNRTGSNGPVVFKAIPNSRALRIVGNVLYTLLNGPDAIASDLSPGIFSFQDSGGDSEPLPHSANSSLKLVVPAAAPYTKLSGFDLKPDNTVAYMADLTAGIQKYVKTNGAWRFAYNFSIPQNIPQADNHATGCFGVVVDFSGAAPIIYATTTEGYGGCVNSNRVVRIVDTNANAVVTTLAQAPSSRIAFRGIDFTPEGPSAGPAR